MGDFQCTIFHWKPGTHKSIAATIEDLRVGGLQAECTCKDLIEMHDMLIACVTKVSQQTITCKVTTRKYPELICMSTQWPGTEDQCAVMIAYQNPRR
jgi:hypothetical protein